MGLNLHAAFEGRSPFATVEENLARTKLSLFKLETWKDGAVVASGGLDRRDLQRVIPAQCGPLDAIKLLFRVVARGFLRVSARDRNQHHGLSLPRTRLGPENLLSVEIEGNLHLPGLEADHPILLGAVRVIVLDIPGGRCRRIGGRHHPRICDFAAVVTPDLEIDFDSLHETQQAIPQAKLDTPRLATGLAELEVGELSLSTFEGNPLFPRVVDQVTGAQDKRLFGVTAAQYQAIIRVRKGFEATDGRQGFIGLFDPRRFRGLRGALVAFEVDSRAAGEELHVG